MSHNGTPLIGGKIPIIKAKDDNVVEAGAVIQITKAVMEHGVLFSHPQMPAFKMYFKFNRTPEGLKVDTRFEHINTAAPVEKGDKG